MSPSDSEDDVEDMDFDNDEDAEMDAEDDALDVEATEDAEEDSAEDSEDASDEDDEDDQDDPLPPSMPMPVDPSVKHPTSTVSTTSSNGATVPQPLPAKLTSPPITPPLLPVVPRKRSLSPVQLRKTALSAFANDRVPPARSITVEAICALPHPVPTHTLAASYCMTHLLTGSDDGYIRDYDIFTAVNSKNFLTAPQRHHCGVVEGIMKAGQLRCWWENPLAQDSSKLKDGAAEDEPSLSPVYSLSMQSDALWGLAGTDSGNINLFTVRHDPGHLIHIFNGHRAPVSALCLDFEEKGFFSAGWDGEAAQWDLDTGKIVRRFTAHGAQLTSVALRPLNRSLTYSNLAEESAEMQVDQSRFGDAMEEAAGVATTDLQSQPESKNQPAIDSDARSDISYDPLFDDDPEPFVGDVDGKALASNNAEQITPSLAIANQNSEPPARSLIPPPKNAPPSLDPSTYAMYSPNVLMTAYIDGQVVLWDRRVQDSGRGVGRLWMSEKTPPWCLSACWSADGSQLYAGRRNGTVDVWDVRLLGRSGTLNTPRLLKTLRNPTSSGVVSCVVAFPDCRHIACASVDNLRLWNVAESVEQDSTSKVKGVQFKIIPGHHGGYVSQMIIDPCERFLVSASSNRGWHGESTRTVFVHDIKHATIS